MAEDRNFVEIQDDAEEISLLDILLIIAEGKGLILKTIAAFAVAGLAYILFFATPKYSTTMQMLPLIALNPTPEVVTMSVPANLVSGIVQSDRTYDGVIDKLNLMGRDGKTIDRNTARKNLKKAMKVEIGGEGIVTVNAKDKSPKMVVDILNTVYSESALALDEVATTLVKQRKEDTEKRLDKKLDELFSEMRTAEGKKDYKRGDNTNRIDSLTQITMFLSGIRNSNLLASGTPLSVKMISAPKLPDKPESQGRDMTVVLSALLGLFVGLTGAFIRHFWRESSSDPETEEKMKRLKALMGFKG